MRLSREIFSVMERGEKIIWKGKQHLKTALLRSVIFLPVILILASLLPPENFKIGQFQFTGLGDFFSSALGVFCLLGYLGIVYINRQVTDYLVTDKRIIIKSGWIGADINSLYYDRINGLHVDVGIVGKIFNTGTISIDTGKIRSTRNGGRETVYDEIRYVKNPYDVYRHAQNCLAGRKESLESGRADYKHNRQDYKDFVQETEKMKKEVS